MTTIPLSAEEKLALKTSALNDIAYGRSVKGGHLARDMMTAIARRTLLACGEEWKNPHNLWKE